MMIKEFGAAFDVSYNVYFIGQQECGKKRQWEAVRGMNQSNHTVSLLDYLTEKTGCNYISDLSRPSELPRIIEVVMVTEASAFSLKQWNEAVNYITKEKSAFETAELAKEHLLRFNN